MPNIALTLPEIDQSVVRPIIHDIIKQVQAITKIDSKAKIFFPGDSQHVQQGGSSIDETSRDAVMNSNRIVFVEVNEDYDAEALTTTAVSYREQLAVFKDKELGILIKPIYITSDVVIDFKYRTQSRSEAFRWRDDIRLRISAMRDINLHNLTYHYLLPAPYLDLLNEIHKLRENQGGYGQSFPEYVTSNSTSRLTLVGDLVNNNARLAVSETQTRVIGKYGFDNVPERPTRDDGTGTWTISFSYKFSYERPAACNFRYPIIIHGQLLDPRFIAFDKTSPDPNQLALAFNVSGSALRHFEQDYNFRKHVTPNAIINLPRYDEFNIKEHPPGTGSVFFALCVADNPSTKEILDLNDLGDLVIDPDILTFIKESEYPYIGKHYQSVIQLNLYRGLSLSSSNSITCDTDLKIKTVADINIRLEYRIRFSLVTDLTMLNTDALDRLRKYPLALAKIVIAINELLRDHPELVKFGKRSRVSVHDFEPFFAKLTGVPYNGVRGKTLDPDALFYNNLNGVPVKLGDHPLDILKPIRGETLEKLRDDTVSWNRVQMSSIIALRLENK